jgi:hypothetical protein
MRYFLLIVGLAMIGFGLKQVYQRITFLLRSQKAYGKPVNWKMVPKMNSRKIYYYPEVVFETPDGTEHRVTSDIGYGSYVGQKPKLPGTIPVRYDPANPDDARFDTVFNLWAPSCAFLLMGGAAIFAFLHPEMNSIGD